MKRDSHLRSVTILAAMACAILAFRYSQVPNSPAAASGTLSVTLTTVSYGGNYADKNIGAIWIADAQDKFVKTLKVWANKRIKHLVKWNAASGGDDTDAVTGATERSHGQRTAEWNCTDVNGTLVADGVYRVYVEFTEDNSSGGGPAGKWLVAEFTKGASDQTVRPGDTANFQNVELVFTAGGGTVQQPATLSGTVVEDGSNAAIADATVQLVSGGQVQYNTTSNASGAFSISNITPGSYTLAVSQSGYTPSSETLTLNDGQSLTGKQVNLTKIIVNASLSGSVLENGSNAAIAGATVQLTSGGQVQYSTSTNASGTFSISNITPATYTLAVSQSGYVPASETLTLNAGQSLTGKTVLLDKVVGGATLSGQILDAVAGTPLANAVVRLQQNGQIMYEVSTDSNGGYQFANVQPGSYSLVATKSGFSIWNEAITLAGGQTVANKNVSLARVAVADTTAPSSPANVRVSRSLF